MFIDSTAPMIMYQISLIGLSRETDIQKFEGVLRQGIDQYIGEW